jgi:hypothetical protein
MYGCDQCAIQQGHDQVARKVPSTNNARLLAAIQSSNKPEQLGVAPSAKIVCHLVEADLIS